QDGQAAVERPPRVVLVRSRKAEVHQHAVAEELRDVPLVRLDGAGADALEATQYLGALLRIGPARKLGETHQVAEQDGQRPALLGRRLALAAVRQGRAAVAAEALARGSGGGTAWTLLHGSPPCQAPSRRARGRTGPAGKRRGKAGFRECLEWGSTRRQRIAM